MRIGICSWAFTGILKGPREVRDLCEAARDAGFGMLEAAYSVRHPLRLTPEDMRTLPVPVASVATFELHRHYLTDPSPQRRERALEIVRDMIGRASACEIASVSFSPGKLVSTEDGDRALDELAGMLGPVVDQAPVDVCLENLPGHILERREVMRSLLARVPRACVCFDIGNALLDPPVGAWFSEFGPRIRKVHLSDGHCANGALSPSLPGQGDVDWPAAVKCLLALDHPADLFVEALAPAGADEPQFLRSCRISADRVFSILTT